MEATFKNIVKLLLNWRSWKFIDKSDLITNKQYEIFTHGTGIFYNEKNEKVFSFSNPFKDLVTVYLSSRVVRKLKKSMPAAVIKKKLLKGE